MTEHPILGQVALGYSPMIDRNRAVIATRLTVFPVKPDIALNTASLLQTLNEVWPGAGGQVSLNIVSEAVLQELMGAELSSNLWIEVPAFMASDAMRRVMALPFFGARFDPEDLARLREAGCSEAELARIGL